MSEQLNKQEEIEKNISLYNLTMWLNKVAAGKMSNALKPRFESYHNETDSFISSYPTEMWAENPNGVIHGGIIAAMLDTAMGMFAISMTDDKFTPTVTIQVCYLRPVPIGDRFVVKSRVTKSGSEIIYTIAEAWMESCPSKLVATSSGAYRVSVMNCPGK